MKNYAQYCPIARTSEILAQRWTPIIVRTLLNGPAGFNTLAAEAPGIPRSLLTNRLRELEAIGLVTRAGSETGQRSTYSLTEPGRDLAEVIMAMGTWGERWLEVTSNDAEPHFLLNSWINSYLNFDALPDRRVIARFDFSDQPSKLTPMWVIFDRVNPEVCRTYPGHEEDLIVSAESIALAEWHLGRIEWQDAVAKGRILVTGPSTLARDLPTWNLRSRWAHLPLQRAEQLLQR